jgi:short-subunit dehydrogenase
MKRDLRGRRAIVTGASGGIGRSVAEALARQGARVALVARTRERLEEAAAQIHARGGEAHVIPGDITLEDDRSRILESATEQLGGLDLLVNNAGVGSWGHFVGSTEEILRQVMEVNFFGPVELIRQAVPALEHGRQPAVVNVASMCARRAMPAWPEYSASKFALAGISESLRGELIRFGIDLLLINPGLTNSGYSSHLLRSEGRANIDFSRGMAPDHVADRIVASVRGNRFETVVGSDARWMLLFNRFFPRWLDRLLGRKVQKLYAN